MKRKILTKIEKLSEAREKRSREDLTSRKEKTEPVGKRTNTWEQDLLI